MDDEEGKKTNIVLDNLVEKMDFISHVQIFGNS